MRFEQLSDKGDFWAVHYDGDEENVFTSTFRQWGDIQWLKNFFTENVADLSSFFKVTDVDEAIFDTLEDRKAFRCVILDAIDNDRLSELFRPLDNCVTSEMSLRKDKAKINRMSKHPSWLRLYAIKFADDGFLITGGAIKLTLRMSEREHTLSELARMEKVRSFLISEGAVDIDGLMELSNEN